MKRLIIFCFVMCHMSIAWATSMCVHDGSYVASLSKSRDGVSMTSNSTTGAWTVTFDYYVSNRHADTATGTAACTEVAGTANTADATVSASPTDTGQYCWCAMATPLVSDWVYSGSYNTDADCASSCASACATNVKTSTAFRTAMFESVW